MQALSAYDDIEAKINAVIIRGFNDDEGPRFAEFARKAQLNVRFIEFMPLGKDDGWQDTRVLPGDELKASIEAVYPLVPIESAGRNPAARWRFADGAPGEIGFINSVSEPFCHSCNRVRLTSDGQLRTCLFSTVERDLKAPLRAGADDRALTALIKAWVDAKEPGHGINAADFERPLRSMSGIGG
ncbi:MAG: hypothetical protein CVV27_14495 [Candidatus Melainabacteria bacterium HGW-Melainabacteria-1]|nr:MAG: hypothetical protein CVV27_14495 [Candidatus Melainabacteria bacterium HGW-Melainabacteria-1]